MARVSGLRVRVVFLKAEIIVCDYFMSNRADRAEMVGENLESEIVLSIKNIQNLKLCQNYYLYTSRKKNGTSLDVNFVIFGGRG